GGICGRRIVSEVERVRDLPENSYILRAVEPIIGLRRCLSQNSLFGCSRDDAVVADKPSAKVSGERRGPWRDAINVTLGKRIAVNSDQRLQYVGSGPSLEDGIALAGPSRANALNEAIITRQIAGMPSDVDIAGVTKNNLRI